MHRAGSAGGGQSQGVAHQLTATFGREFQARLGDGSKRRLEVEHLVGMASDLFVDGLGRDDQYRGSVEVGVGNTAVGVGSPGSQGREADPGLAGEAGLGIGHVDG